ncbi:TPA: hypothetical protein DCF80_01615 [Candidatus Saccharibacteria bacterium]|nr:hypothetical protein [Candidatus Saccharibacteria bacterium]HRK41137.1 phosphatase PAP2 family protein [Candidatus Saccharibacteria bacterium]
MDLVVRLAADGLLIVIVFISVVTVLLSIRSAFWKMAAVIVMAALTSLLAGKILSLMYQPEVARPFLEQGMAPGAAYIDNPGFPSDHALLATVMVVAVYAVTKKKWLTVLLAVLLVIMCVARVVALVHTPFDVIGGVFAGLIGAVWYRKLTN